ncbi:MAG: hypothetical protein COB30_011230 [Ectothiorhodospiraceae bacterium]|nr:hypothetical protein [Ectothiorhodospiraceae bacterium]
MRWLEKIPLIPLLLAAIFMGLAPFRPEPHLWEKLTMLFSGSLTQPLDMFDLLQHSALLILVAIKLVLGRRKEELSQ